MSSSSNSTSPGSGPGCRSFMPRGPAGARQHHETVQNRSAGCFQIRDDPLPPPHGSGIPEAGFSSRRSCHSHATPRSHSFYREAAWQRSAARSES
uniref:Uncharacterized protein n=1 Tax=Pseudomonas fluorescens (strain SBW25) TaxID=216595 RepID=A4V7B3_PSEFS|nr:hypothetical protein pQBR0014 [Pseudomonas fluorescens SBW25]